MNLIHGDCLSEMKNIPDNSIDMVLTDPPYGTTACKWDNIIPFEPMWEQLKRITKDNGAICLFGSEPFSSHLRLSNLKWFKYDWVWNKVNKFTGFLNAKRMPLTDNEIISVFYKKQSTYNPQKREGTYITRMYGNQKTPENYGKHEYKNDNKRIINGLNPGRIISIKAQITKGKLHPTQKPVPLLEYLIKTYTLEGETVLDFTMGSCSTGMACKNLGRKFIGIELDETYFKIAQDRINAD